MFDFFYGNEAEQYQFYRVPQALFTNEQFSRISCESKLLYGFLLDRCGLSRKNKWCDEDGKLYVFFKQEEACEKLNIGKDKAIKIFNELEKIGLIFRKKQGQGKPTKIYVCNFAKELVFSRELSSVDSQTSTNKQEKEVLTSENPKSENTDCCSDIQSDVQTSENQKSKHREIRSHYILGLNHTEINHTNPSIYQDDKTEPKSEADGWTDEKIREYEEYIKTNIGYNSLLQENISPNTLDMIVDIMLEAYNPLNDYIKIQGQPVKRIIVLRQYEKLDIDHVRYILDSIKDEAKLQMIKNLRMYLKSCLYNAPHSMDMHFENKAEFDKASKSTKGYAPTYDIAAYESTSVLDEEDWDDDQ